MKWKVPPQANVSANTSSASKWAHIDDADDEDDVQESPDPTISAPGVMSPVAEAFKVQVHQPFFCYATTHAVLGEDIGEMKPHLLVL